MINFDEYKHEWKFDLPWHMVNLKDWFYMVNVGHFGDVFLHVRILGIRSLWTFPEPESRRTKHARTQHEGGRYAFGRVETRLVTRLAPLMQVRSAIHEGV